MATSEEVAQAYQIQQSNLATATARSVVAQYQQLDEHALSESWAAGVGPRVQATVEQAQLTAAQAAAPYLAELAAAQGMPIAAPLIVASALSGIASDGRPLASLLYLPILLIKNLLGLGVRYPEAFRRGLTFAGTIAATQVSDAGRGGVTVGMVAEKSWVSYIRVLRMPSCARCIVLAGRVYSYSTGFQRHERCDCEIRPVRRGSAEWDQIPLPEEVFEGMSREEQDKVFGKAGAESIRLGADIGQVVNARRGKMTTAAGRLITTEGTTVRGIAGKRLGDFKKQPGERYRRSQNIRPMPEELIKEANGDRDLAIQMLYRFGYIWRLPET